MKHTIYCDGGSLGNPGYGYGSFQVTMSEGSIIKGTITETRLKLGNHLTNNESEYKILIKCLEKIIGLLNKEDTVEIFTDSLLMMKQMRGNW